MKLRGAAPWIAAAVGLGVRLLWMAFSHPASFDLESYVRVAACPAARLYTAPALEGRYPYLPLWWSMLRACAAARSCLGGLEEFWYRLPAVAGDTAICALAAVAAGRRFQGVEGKRAGVAALAAGLCWALNPAAVLVSAGHGQFDALALALLLGAFLALERKAASWAGAAFAGAIALKTWPLFLLPFAWARLEGARDRGRCVAWALVPPALLLLPWLLISGPAVVFARLGYSGANALGLSGALKIVGFLLRAAAPWRAADAAWRIGCLLAIAAGFVWAWLRPSKGASLAAPAWAALGLEVFAPGLSVQYLIWAPALALLDAPALSLRLSAAALPTVLGYYALLQPGALGATYSPPTQTVPLLAAWGLVNLAWWAWSLREWARLAPRLKYSEVAA